MSISVLSVIFLILTVTMAALMIALLLRYLTAPARALSVLSVIAYLVYTGVLGYIGVVAMKKPPGLLFVLLPAILFMATYLTRNPGVKAFASRVPGYWWIGLQVYRALVEIGLLGLYQNRLIPRMLTFEGANFDILIGLSAPVVAYLYTQRKISVRAVRIWNVLGIVLLANVAIRAFLTFSGVLPSDIPNTGLGIFPFTFLPGFLAPLALYLHVLSLRGLGVPPEPRSD